MVNESTSPRSCTSYWSEATESAFTTEQDGAGSPSNSRKRARRNGASSRYRGVSWFKANQVWKAQITVKGKYAFLGYFEKEEDAAFAYDLRALAIHGDDAQLNFPEKAVHLDRNNLDQYVPVKARTGAKRKRNNPEEDLAADLSPADIIQQLSREELSTPRSGLSSGLAARSLMEQYQRFQHQEIAKRRQEEFLNRLVTMRYLQEQSAAKSAAQAAAVASAVSGFSSPTASAGLSFGDLFSASRANLLDSSLAGAGMMGRYPGLGLSSPRLSLELERAALLSSNERLKANMAWNAQSRSPVSPFALSSSLSFK